MKKLTYLFLFAASVVLTTCSPAYAQKKTVAYQSCPNSAQKAEIVIEGGHIKLITCAGKKIYLNGNELNTNGNVIASPVSNRPYLEVSDSTNRIALQPDATYGDLVKQLDTGEVYIWLPAPYGWKVISGVLNDTTGINAALATKADATTVTTALAAKANVAEVNTALSAKANATALANKADLVNGLIPAAQLPPSSGGGSVDPDAPTAADFPSLSNAVSTIGTSNKTLNVKATTSLDASTVVPATLNLEIDNNGIITCPTAGTTLTIRGHLKADKNRQIFAANCAGKIIFDGDYPDLVFPEWFGAKGDALLNSFTDDYAAIQAMFDSFRNANTAGQNINIARGAKVFFSGKNYAITQTIQVNTTTDIELSPATQIIQKNGNLSAFRFNTYYTEDTTPAYQRTSAHSRLHGTGALLANGGNFTHTVNAANTVFTSQNRTEITLNRVTGGNFAEDVVVDYSGENHESRGFDEGYTVTFGGLTWIIKQRVSNDQVILYPFRLRPQATGDSQTIAIIIPNTLPQNLVGATIAIEGRPRVIDTITTAGNLKLIHLTQSTGLTLASGDSFDAEIIRLPTTNFQGTSARFNANGALDIRIAVDVSDISIQGFSGHALQLDSTRAPSNIPQTQPNQNNATFRNIHAKDNAGCAVYARGVNSNNILIDSLDSQTNECGIFDISFLGNLYIKPHLALDTQGSFIGVSGVQGSQVYGSKVLYGYTEGGMPSTILSANSMWDEGDASTGFANYYTGAITANSGGEVDASFFNGRAHINNLSDYVSFRKGATGDVNHRVTGNTLVLGANRGNTSARLVGGDNTGTPSFLKFGIDTDANAALGTGISYSLNSYTPSNVNTGIISLTYGSETALDPTKIPFYLTTSTTPIVVNSNSFSNAGKIVFPTGMYFGQRNDFTPAANTLMKVDVNSSGLTVSKGLSVNGNIQIASLTGGLIQKTPAGDNYKISVANGGALSTTLQPPDVVPVLSFVSKAVGSVSLSWTPSNGVVSYRVEYSPANNFPSGVPASSGGTSSTVIASPTTTATINGLPSGVFYYFRVIAYNTAGETSPSNVLQILLQ
jgi:hypothetical protein